ncbi:hypothetical protein BC833DRAFT_575763 [Globomyces pollinis-pini]|nr:hypothetical protein BC833DRAFT_575763 [Globomyces pollinis-pini]
MFLQDLEIHRLSIANDLNDLLVEKGRQYHIFRIFTFLVGILMTIGFFAGRFIIGLNSTLQYVFLSFACIGFLIMLASFGAVFRERLLLKSVQKFIDNLNSNDNLTYRYEIRQVDRDDKDFEGSKTTVQDWLVTVTIPV